ncbi:putative RING-H2 finger protein ATL21A isoform X2 [Henckelia pumila]|uniref:putative RING-H2 finger protein ATL21A isoform X2 n=1 Tax=Henckelia pumila TaxID=405737 RepID=UPI003C6E0878
MEIIFQILLFTFSILIIFSIPTQSVASCKPESCDIDLGPEVRFPFRLTRQPVRCGYPGFELSCNSKKETILKLPVSGEFRVNSIDYISQTLSMRDPGPCLPIRIPGFDPSGTPFRGAHAKNYTFFNCSSGRVETTGAHAWEPVRCLSGRNYTVLATSPLSPEEVRVPPTCRRIANAWVPGYINGSWSSDWREDFDLQWSDPACSDCENQGRVCGFKNDSRLQTGCYERARRSGMSRKTKYGLIIGVGIPGLVCIIGLVCHTCGLIKSIWLRPRLNSELPTVMVPDPQLVTHGLDEPTIESYPKMVLGESRRLPEPSDGTCPICLSEYQPKDTLRSIPECNHYFHVGCIDEWLKLNGTCPLCRNSPDGSTVTPCSSLSSLSLITPSSTPSSRNL